MSKKEERDVTLRRITFPKVPIGDLTDSELQEIVSKMEADMADESESRGVNTTGHLFGYIAIKYAIRLYQIDNWEKNKQKAEEKRLDETIKMLKDFLKQP